MFLIFRITVVLIEATTLLPSSPSDNENSTRTEMITEAAEESTFFTEDLDISSTMKIDMIESDNNTNVESTTLIEEETSRAGTSNLKIFSTQEKVCIYTHIKKNNTDLNLQFQEFSLDFPGINLFNPSLR